MVTLEGLIERITYQNIESGFCILKAKIKRDLICVIGHSSCIQIGEHFQAEGNWVFHKEYGKQFKAEKLISYPPSTLEGIEKYIGSGLIKGIGPFFAKKLIDFFGYEIFNVIENSPKQLEQINGISKIRSLKIQKSWEEQKHIREIMLFLHNHGVSTSRAVQIYRKYKETSIKIIQQNPYQLIKDIRGIGFISADKIAKNVGIGVESKERISAGLQFILLSAQDKGHCGLPAEELIFETSKLLEINNSLVLQIINEDVLSKELILEQINNKQIVFLASFYRMEQYIAGKIHKMLKLNQAINYSNIKAEHLSPSQSEALKKVVQSRVSIVTGGPGVGKTTLIKCLLEVFKNNHIKLCAPTGRAARRLSESTAMNATTIHRLLEPNIHEGGFKRNENNKIDCNLLIVDEVSMVDLPLMYALLKAINDDCILILTGDVDQLPSVGPGQVLADMISSEIIPTAKLTEIFRQTKESKIITNAHRINTGLMPISEGDFYFIKMESAENGLEKILKIISERLPKKFKINPITDVQILSPMNRGILGTGNLNIELKKLLNGTFSEPISAFGKHFSIGDKVIMTVNDYEKDVYNGDIGFIKDINFNSQEVIINFNELNTAFAFAELDVINLAYAITIHKSQGSEFPIVLIPLSMSHYPMLMRNLIYTAVTRAQKLVIIVGDKKALWLSVHKQQSLQRWTNLKEKLICVQRYYAHLNVNIF